METYQREKRETEAKDDPAARTLLREAFEKTERWPKGFAGYSADLVLNQNGSLSKGTIKVVPGEEVGLQIDDASLAPWAKNQIGMMAVHRGPRNFDESDGKYVLTFGTEDNHPLGRTVLINGDGMDSRYRIKDGRILQINRTMGKMRFTINIQDSMTTVHGRHLTTHYAVYYFSVSEGALLQVDAFHDQHHPLDGIYLPKQRQVLSSDQSEVLVRQMSFSNHRLLG